MRNSKMRDKTRKYLLSTAAMLGVVAAVASVRPVAADSDDHHGINPNNLKTKTPIKHLVVVFNENRSFDHYFGTYPNALNLESRFLNRLRTPRGISTTC